MSMKLRVIVEIEVVDGATHYSGDLLDNPTLYKCTQVAGFDHWWYYDRERVEWFLSGHGRPYWINKLEHDLVIGGY